MQIRRADTADAVAISTLLGKVNPANPKMDPDVLLWQYWKNPFGEALSYVWDDDGKIVCHVARIPVQVLIQGVPSKGALTVDAATDPSYRERGLYTKLRDRSNESCLQAGFLVCLDFRAATTRLPRGSALGAGAFHRHVILLDARWLAERVHLPGSIARMLMRPVREGRGLGQQIGRTPADIDVLWEAFAARIGYGSVKSGAWWRWRYDAHPRRRYRYFELRQDSALLAAAVTTARQDMGSQIVAVLDLVSSSRDAARRLMSTIARESPNAAALAFLAPRRTAWSGLARRAGFVKIPGWLDRSRPTLNVRDLTGGLPEFLTVRWDVTWGDMDHI